MNDTLNGESAWGLRKWIPYLLGLIMLFDSWDLICIAFVLPSIAKEWGLGPVQSGWLISAGYGGQFLGAVTCGALAERWGRLPVLKPIVIVMCLLAIACGLSQSYGQLVAIRLVQGFAIGGALPVAISYINEIAPAKTRGRFFGTFQFLMLAGYGLSSLASAFVVPVFGWRAMFFLGAAPLLLAPFLYGLPESPRWLAARGRIGEAVKALQRLGGRPPEVANDAAQAQGGATERRPSTAILFSPEYRSRTVVTFLLWFLTSLVSFGLVTWVPSIYVSVFKIPVPKALQYSAIAAIFIFVIPLVLRQTIDIVGRRLPALLGAAVGGAALVALAFIDHSLTTVIVTLTITGQVGASIGSMVLWPYSAEVYETRVRALALGAASSLARGASMLTPLAVGGVLAATNSIAPVFMIFGVSAVSAAILWIFFTKETAGREMD
jgi:putative MFS transporter